MEDPLHSNCLTPINLIMTRMCCFYCNGPQDNIICVGDRMGLKTCTHHSGWANRDCNAWLAKEQVVRLSDARRHPGLKPFVEEADKGFSVRRTSGVIESGWTLQTPIVFLYPPMVRYSAGEWHLPCRTTNDVEKMVPLSQFIDLGSEDMREFALTAKGILDAGIYSKDYADHMEYFQSGIDMVAELPEVSMAEFEGELLRVWLHPGPALTPVQAEASDGPSGAENCTP
uniref:Uncharacterized protein n=1 Tax=viral metagenome TaxID=1070528 RepID=A0A6C0KW42_9ZZZZ